MKFVHFVLPVLILLFAASFSDKNDKKQHPLLFGNWKHLYDFTPEKRIVETQLPKEPVEKPENKSSLELKKDYYSDIYNYGELESSMVNDDMEQNEVYNSVMNYYNQHYVKPNGTDNSELIKIMLKKLLYGVPVFFGYYRVFSYLNELCATGATCSNVTVTTSVTSTKLKSTRLTETAVLTSMKTKTATSSISETSTTFSTTVRITTLPATSTTYTTTTKTSKSTVTTITTTTTPKTFTFKFSESTTTTRQTTSTRTSVSNTNNGMGGRLIYIFDIEDVETIELSPTAGLEMTSTYAWYKFSALMTSLETTTESDGHDDWTTQESPTDQLDHQQFSQSFHVSILESSKSFTDSTVAFDDY